MRLNNFVIHALISLQHFMALNADEHSYPVGSDCLVKPPVKLFTVGSRKPSCSLLLHTNRLPPDVNSADLRLTIRRLLKHFCPVVLLWHCLLTFAVVLAVVAAPLMRLINQLACHSPGVRRLL